MPPRTISDSSDEYTPGTPEGLAAQNNGDSESERDEPENDGDDPSEVAQTISGSSAGSPVTPRPSLPPQQQTDNIAGSNTEPSISNTYDETENIETNANVLARWCNKLIFGNIGATLTDIQNLLKPKLEELINTSYTTNKGAAQNIKKQLPIRWDETNKKMDSQLNYFTGFFNFEQAEGKTVFQTYQDKAENLGNRPLQIFNPVGCGDWKQAVEKCAGFLNDCFQGGNRWRNLFVQRVNEFFEKFGQDAGSCPGQPDEFVRFCLLLMTVNAALYVNRDAFPTLKKKFPEGAKLKVVLIPFTKLPSPSKKKPTPVGSTKQSKKKIAKQIKKSGDNTAQGSISAGSADAQKDDNAYLHTIPDSDPESDSDEQPATIPVPRASGAAGQNVQKNQSISPIYLSDSDSTVDSPLSSTISSPASPFPLSTNLFKKIKDHTAEALDNYEIDVGDAERTAGNIVDNTYTEMLKHILPLALLNDDVFEDVKELQAFHEKVIQIVYNMIDTYAILDDKKEELKAAVKEKIDELKDEGWTKYLEVFNSVL